MKNGGGNTLTQGKRREYVGQPGYKNHFLPDLLQGRDGLLLQ